MVTNSFGTRNAMQPMGRLKHSLKAPCFFSFFPIGGGGGGGWGGVWFFFIFPWFPCVPNMFFIALHSCPICFGKYCPSFTYIGAPKGMKSILQNRTFYFREPP